MKTKIFVLISLIAGHILAQNFVNLNFENAHFTPDPFGSFPPYSVFASNSIPGWTAYWDGVPQTDILSNDMTFGSAMVSIQGTNLPYFESFVQPALQGRWSVFLEGLFGDTNTYTGGYPIVASIGQNGQIPLAANSLLFWAYFPFSNNTFSISFNGQNLTWLAVSNALNYTVYGADVSAFAGQTGQLLFSAGNYTYAELDSISFSTQPVPEPSELALIVLGTLFFGFRRQRNSSR
jgi:hypothetical protein